MSMDTMKACDLAVIGGGPAGMMCAITAAERGLSVVLLEPNQKLGRKLRITGKGRCNLTNNCDIRTFMANTRPNAAAGSFPSPTTQTTWRGC